MNSRNYLNKYRFVAFVLTLTFLLVLILPMIANSGLAFGHGFVGDNSEEGQQNSSILRSRAALSEMGYNQDIGQVKWEPESIMGQGNFPKNGPQDGKLASGGVSNFEQIDQQATTKWARQHVVIGDRQSVTVNWTITAPHQSFGFRYFLTKPDWDGQSLNRSDFAGIDGKPLSVDNASMFGRSDTIYELTTTAGAPTQQERTHRFALPTNRTGYSVLLAVWDISEEDRAFYNVIDLYIHSSQSDLEQYRQDNADKFTTDWNIESGESGSGNIDGQKPTPPSGNENGSLQVPQAIVNSDSSIVRWNSVEGATSYNIWFEASVYNQTNRTFSLVNAEKRPYYIMLQTVKGSEVSLWSPWITVNGGILGGDDGNTDETENAELGYGGLPIKLETPRLSMTGNFLTWRRISKADGFHIVLNGTHYVLGDKNALSFRVPNVPGRHSVFIRAFQNDSQGKEVATSGWTTWTREVGDFDGFVPKLDIPKMTLRNNSNANSQANVDGQQSDFVVNINGKIMFFSGNGISLSDLGLKQSDVKRGSTTLLVQAVNGVTSSDWSEPLYFEQFPQWAVLLLVLSISLVIIAIGFFFIVCKERQNLAKTTKAK
ncbi:MAG: lytic polysaccharide monooxygenase [Clostridiales bacterium]|jgi:predicted carbohydrate-binding protein with CBM5 and CBM33 domain|nr:lytic polysaccharide monooxygenase [Clostridiales bacterium]